jgi:type VI protein secretion system component Hcp
MKLFFLLAFTFALCTSAYAQDGSVVVNTGNKTNCVTAEGEQGFAARTWSIGGTVTDNIASKVGSTSAPALHDLSITKNVDACSSQLIQDFLGALGGKPIPTVTLIQYSAAKGEQRPVALITLTLTDAIINSYSISGAPSVNPVETLTFDYKKMCFTNVTLGDEGQVKSTVTTCYDRSLNKVS